MNNVVNMLSMETLIGDTFFLNHNLESGNYEVTQAGNWGQDAIGLWEFDSLEKAKAFYIYRVSSWIMEIPEDENKEPTVEDFFQKALQQGELQG